MDASFSLAGSETRRPECRRGRVTPEEQGCGTAKVARQHARSLPEVAGIASDPVEDRPGDREYACAVERPQLSA